MPLFVVAETHDVRGHHLRVLAPNAADWLTEVAEEYRRLRTQTRQALTSLTLNGVTIVDVSEVERAIAAATVPRYQAGNFGVVRSDLAEVALALMQAELYGSRYGYRSVRDREVRQLPGRGIDQIGVEVTADGNEDRVTLVLGEAKVSSDSRHPPAVVETNTDCLQAQHAAHLTEREATADKVWEASRHADDPEVQELLQLSAHLFRIGDPRLRVVASSIMIRPKSLAQAPADFGCFHTEPEQFEPAHVRFHILQVEGDIDQLARDLADLAAAEDGDAA